MSNSIKQKKSFLKSYILSSDQSIFLKRDLDMLDTMAYGDHVPADWNPGNPVKTHVSVALKELEDDGFGVGVDVPNPAGNKHLVKAFVKFDKPK